ncbi:cardioexcitatory receptor [Elysia marginata]|uniref:Cardioexcitatory receptor n=1 Tax=Elysia marginata TaxID=1093978 RepID=A0AAV4HU22_9GAST|nr:cardioexcitatory receptor [Elysia marginata]
MSASLTVIINTTRHRSNSSNYLHHQHYDHQSSLNSSLGRGGNAALPQDYDDMGDYGDKEQPLYAQVIIVLMYVLIIIVAVGGNLLFSYVIVMRAKTPSVTNLFLLNLAISDLMKAIICNPFTFMANLIWMYWPYGDFMCPVVTYIQISGARCQGFRAIKTVLLEKATRGRKGA